MKLLANPNQSVSEIAYSVGFQALTQFNNSIDFSGVSWGNRPLHFDAV
jgi:hypothetical protein